MAQNTDHPDHALKVADLDDAALSKWLKANHTRLAQIAFDWPFWRRPDQAEPAGDWRCWLLLAGRGFGKTRTGAEWVRARAEADGRLRIALVAATMADARAIMVEGESGLLSIAPEDMRPNFEPSLHRLVWPNGAMAKLYSAAEPEGLRGPEHHIYAVVEDMHDAPPASPAEGACWLVSPSPVAEWSNHAGAIAQWTLGGWRFVDPFEGLQVWQRSTGLMLRHNGGNWSADISAASLRIGGQQVVGPRIARISEPSGGAVVDTECRARLVELIAALQTHGLISN